MNIDDKILILGGTGFIGNNMINYLLQKKNNLNIVVLTRTIPVWKIDGIIYEHGDFGDRQILEKLFSKWHFTKIFHFASSSIPVSSNSDIINGLSNNIISTIYLLEVMRKFGCKYILYLSSGGAVYGENNNKLISELELCNPISSYGVEKLTIENYLRLYQKQFGINYLILRVANPFGEYHLSEKQGVINISIRRAVKQTPIEIWGDGNQAKDYIYVRDLVEIIDKLVRTEVYNKTINIGRGKSYTLNYILDKIRCNIPTFKFVNLESKSSDVTNFCLDVSLLESLIDFKFTDFDEAIRRTIDWEKQML